MTRSIAQYCLVCGVPRGKGRGCCGDPICSAFLTLHPEVREEAEVAAAHTGATGEARAKVRAAKRSKQHQRSTAIKTAIVDHGGVLEQHAVEKARPENPREDHRRGADKYDSPWAWISPKLCVFHKTADKEDEIGLRLVVPEGFSVAEYLEKTLGGSTFLGEFDYILAWRCGCRQQTKVLYHTVREFPDTAGRHGVCPLCNAAAVNIVRE